jgi:hypothetical protein
MLLKFAEFTQTEGRLEDDGAFDPRYARLSKRDFCRIPFDIERCILTATIWRQLPRKMLDFI